MSHLPKESMDFSEIISLSIKRYKTTFTAIVVFVFFMTIAQGIQVYLLRMSLPTVMEWVVLIAFGVLFLYFGACALYQTQLTFADDQYDIHSTAKLMLRRMPNLLIALIILVGGMVLWHYLIYHLGMAWIGHPQSHPGRMLIFMLFFYFCPLIVALGFFSYVIPIIVLDNVAITSVFGRAMKLVGDKWLKGFSLYLGFGLIAIAVWPGSRHANFLLHHHLLILFDLCVYVLLLPVYFNMIVLLINEFKLLRNQPAQS